MRQLPKEPTEQTSAALVLFIRTFTPGVLILLLFAVLLQLIVIEQQIPLKRIVYQIEQVIVIKHVRLHYRLASIHNVVEKPTGPCGHKFILSASCLRLSIVCRNACATERLQIR